MSFTNDIILEIATDINIEEEDCPVINCCTSLEKVEKLFEAKDYIDDIGTTLNSLAPHFNYLYILINSSSCQTCAVRSAYNKLKKELSAIECLSSTAEVVISKMEKVILKPRERCELTRLTNSLKTIIEQLECSSKSAYRELHCIKELLSKCINGANYNCNSVLCSSPSSKWYQFESLIDIMADELGKIFYYSQQIEDIIEDLEQCS